MRKSLGRGKTFHRRKPAIGWTKVTADFEKIQHKKK